MIKLKLSLILLTTSLCSLAQNSKEQANFMFETDFGISTYDVVPIPVSSLQLHFGSVIHEVLSMGMFLNGYTATGSANHPNPLVSDYSPIPHGGRLGIFFRANSSNKPNVSHVYAQIKGSAGYLFQSGLADDVDEDKGLELLAGLDLGFNASLGNNSYFGFFIGAEGGSLDMEAQPQKTSILRYNIGLRIQKRY